MDFLLTFLEGVISFISPCVLPLLPVYITYLTGSGDEKRGKITRPLGFVLGFTSVFCLMGLFAGALSLWLHKYGTAVNIICGIIVIIFGLSYLDVIHIKIFKGLKKKNEVNSFLSAVLFGVVYSVSLSPCVGAFLGSAIMLAAGSGTALKGTLLLLVYSLGMGIPFLLSAIFIEKLTATFKVIKKHYKQINTVCGIFLIIVGILMAFGLINHWSVILS